MASDKLVLSPSLTATLLSRTKPWSPSLNILTSELPDNSGASLIGFKFIVALEGVEFAVSFTGSTTT